ncbi:MAG: tetratricopeptide repeat protein [Steroidobacteraceae bacterium]
MPTVMLVGSIVIQALLIVHVIKTGRNQIWIWVLALLSFPGVIAYVAVELIPDVLKSRSTRSAVKGVKQALDPEADLRRYQNEARLTGNVSSNQKYAEELMRQDKPREAAEIYRTVLKGLYEHDPNLMLGLATAQFKAGSFAEARATLDQLIATNPEFKSPQGHLLYARALEGEGATERALSEYRVLAGYFSGAEAAVRYAQLLRSQGQGEEAGRVLRDLLEQASVAPPHYRRTQKDWLDRAQREVSTL